MNGLRKKIQILTLSVITAMALMPQFVSAESNNTTQSGIGFKLLKNSVPMMPDRAGWTTDRKSVV